MDLTYDTLSLKPELEDSSSPYTPNSTSSSTSSNSSVFFGSRNTFENRSLPVGSRKRPQSLLLNQKLSIDASKMACRENRPLSCILESKSEGTRFDAAGLKRRQLNSSVSGEVSFVRERGGPSSFPLLPPNYPLASPENPLRNTPLPPGTEIYQLPPPRRSSMRRSNRRYSFKDRRAHGVQCRYACPHNKMCSDHVVTEDNSRTASDPQLLWLKHFESNPIAKLRSFSDNSFLKTQEVHRKIISSASVSGLCNMNQDNHEESEGIDSPNFPSEDECDTNCDMAASDPIESRWSDIEHLSNTLSQTSITNGEVPTNANAMNESLDSDVFDEACTETYGAKFSFAQFFDPPSDSSTPHRVSSEKRRKSKVRSQETPTINTPTDNLDGEVEMTASLPGRQLTYVNESEETTKL